MIRSDKTVVLYAQENEYGVRPDTGWRRFGLHDVANLPDPEFAWTPYYSLGGVNRAQIIRGKNVLAGSVPAIHLQSKFPLYPLFPPNDTQPLASISLANGIYDTNGVLMLGRQYLGGRINRATISLTEGEDLILDIEEMLFQKMFHNRFEASTNRYLTSPALPADPGPSSNYRYTWNGVTFTAFGGTVLNRVRKFTLSVNNNLIPQYGLTTGQSPDAFNQPMRILCGQTEYKMNLTVDIHEAELALWDYLMNQGSNKGSGPTVGTTFRLNFSNLDESFSLHCSVSPTATNPGTVFEKVDFPIDSTKGYYTATFRANVDRVYILT